MSKIPPERGRSVLQILKLIAGHSSRLSARPGLRTLPNNKKEFTARSPRDARRTSAHRRAGCCYLEAEYRHKPSRQV